MKKTCLYVLMISALLALVALWVATIRGMISEDVSAAEQVAEAVKTTLESKKQESTEAESCRQVTEAIETKVSTENATEETTTEASYIEPKTTESGCYEESTKMVFVSERKTAERTAVTTEEIYGEIDEDGYGWVQLQYSAPYNICENHLTHDNGSINVYGHHETWYSTKEAAGQATAVDIPGKHVADDGTIRDEDGYICVASSDHDFYTIVMTSVGPGKVYDTGCSHGTIDVYTTW